MIIRIFTVKVPHDLSAEFEPKFKTISFESVSNAKGCISVSIGRSVQRDTDRYVMVSQWEDLASLKDFAGENWHEPHIPELMKKYALACEVEHFEGM